MRLIRARAGLAAAGVIVFGLAVLMLGLVVSAGAVVPTSGSIVTTAAQPQAPFTSGIPFASGQNINVVIPANSAFAAPNNNSGVNILECSAPNGVPPVDPNVCQGDTIQGNTILPATDGSFTFSGYSLYALPDSVTLGEAPSSPPCGQTAATECILYIGNQQSDFTKPHLWSAPFFISSNATDSGTPAGDGSAPALGTTPSPSVSTVVPAPTTATADGADPSTVTVTLLTSGSVPVPGKAVSLTPSPSGAKVTGPSPALTDANGQTTFSVTDTTAQPVTLTAVDTTDSVTLAQTPSVTFQAPKVDAVHSSVIANPTSVPTPGQSTTITVTLRDQAVNAQPVAGQTVTLAGTGSAVITPAATPNVTNASGVVTFTATDTAAEAVTFTATDTTQSTVISNTASVTFGTLNVSASQSTVTAATPAPVGSKGTAVVVTLLSSTSSPVAGKTVSLSSSGSAVVGAPTSATTGANGQVSFPVTDTVPETVTLTAKDTTDNITLTSTPTVTFAAGSPSATASDVSTQATTSPADGETQTLIIVTVKDQFGNPLSGKTVTIQGVPSVDVQIHPIAVVGGSTPGITDASGAADFQASDSHAESVTFTATDTTDGNLVLTKTVSITFTPGPADPAAQGTTVTVAPANPPADGSTPATITVTLTDYFANPIAGTTIALKAVNGTSTVTAVNPVTNAAGQATFTVTDSKAEIVTYQATDVTDSNAVIAAEGVVKFGNPPAPPPDAAFCSVVASPSSVPADGTHTATISVLLYDGNGAPVTGKTVALAGSGGASKVATTNTTTDNSGMATFAVSDATAESVKYTASDTSDSINLTAIPVTVTFTPAAATTTTTTTTSTTSTSTTSTTTPAGTTATTTPTGAAVSGVTSAGSSSAGNTGNTGTGSSTASLAVTGSPTLLPWLIGLGALFLGVGTIGRRRFSGGRNDA